MVKHKTAEGLNFSSMVMDILLLTLSVGYNLHFEYPLTAYAENVVILVQNYIIFYLSWKFNRIESNNFFVGSGIGIVVLLLFLAGCMPEEVYLYNQMLVAVLSRLTLPSIGIKRSSNSGKPQEQIDRSSQYHYFVIGMRWKLR